MKRCRSGAAMLLRRIAILILLLVGTVGAEVGDGTVLGRRAVAAPGEEEGQAGTWPRVDAEGIMVMDVGSHRVLYERDSDHRLRPASTTKIMTALVAIENGQLDDMVTVSGRAAKVEGSRVYLDEGERQSLRDLLYALMLQSANDAAIAIAEHVGGSEEAFVRLMNEKARSLGAKGTHFVNPHGLDAPDHYTTARDLAIISAHALGNPTFRQIVSTRRWEMPWPAKGSTRVLHNENRLLADGDGTGVKTGYTVASGHCVVGSARRGRFEVVVVLLKSTRGFWEDVRKLLDHSFAGYQPFVLVREGQPLGSIELPLAGPVTGVAASDVVVPLSAQERDLASGAPEVSWLRSLHPPLQAGQQLGTARVTVPGVATVTVPVVTASAVELPPRIRRDVLWTAVVLILGLAGGGAAIRYRQRWTKTGRGRTGVSRQGREVRYSGGRYPRYSARGSADWRRLLPEAETGGGRDHANSKGGRVR